jgi:predicted neuraminidase
MAAQRTVVLGWMLLGLIATATFADDRAAAPSGPRPVTRTDLVDDTRLSPLVLAEFIYDDAHAPTPQCHATTIAETPAGLIAAWFGGQHEKNPDVGIWVSRKVDGGWTAPVEVMNGVQHSTLRYPCWNPVLFQQAGGTLHLFAKCGPNPSEWWGTHQTSSDHGITWTRSVRLPSQIDGPVKNKPVLLPDGTLLCGSSTEYDGWRVHFESTKDWGLTWDRVGPINDGKEAGAIQPTILVHPSPAANSHTVRLQALLRHQQKQHILSTWSDDSGRTWSPLTPISLPNPNSGIDAVTLADGAHLLIYNHTQKGRSPLNVAVSRDGNDWQAAFVLESEPGEYSYPAVIQSADGLVHITYTWKRTKVKHAVIDPTKLVPRPFVDGQWPQ